MVASWDQEREGQVAQIFRELSRLEAAEDRVPLFEQLRALTGQSDLGDDLPRWLSWYVEDHLGLQEAVDVMGAHAASVAPTPTPVDIPLASDPPVFEQAEYNWCALNRVTNKDDMLKLRMLHVDLEHPIHTQIEGPFSFRRITGADEDDLRFFEGKSLTQSIFDERVQLRHLRVLKNYGKTMMMPVLPASTQRSGAVIYSAAICQALVRFDTKITSLSFKDLAESLPALIERPYLVESYVNLLKEAHERCH